MNINTIKGQYSWGVVHLAAKRNSVEMIKKAIAAGADVDFR